MMVAEIKKEAVGGSSGSFLGSAWNFATGTVKLAGKGLLLYTALHSGGAGLMAMYDDYYSHPDHLATSLGTGLVKAFDVATSDVAIAAHVGRNALSYAIPAMDSASMHATDFVKPNNL
jgi:hypothetical protein